MTIKTEQFEATLALEPPYIKRYYDYHLDEVEGNELSQQPIHVLVIDYLLAALSWLFHDQNVGVIREINLFYTTDPHEMPRSPDVTAIDGYDPQRHSNHGYTMYPPYFPSPRLVIEVASEKTWNMDFKQKFDSYQAMGVQEYFIFDPGQKRNWNKERQQQAGGTRRLIGWFLNADKQFERLPLINNDRIWSVQADSWLVVEGQYLRLYDAQNQPRLTEVEHERELRKQEEQLRKQEEQLRKQEEQLRKQEEQLRKQEEQLRNLDKERIEKLAAKLRELNINPDDLLK